LHGTALFVGISFSRVTQKAQLGAQALHLIEQIEHTDVPPQTDTRKARTRIDPLNNSRKHRLLKMNWRAHNFTPSARAAAASRPQWTLPNGCGYYWRMEPQHTHDSPGSARGAHGGHLHHPRRPVKVSTFPATLRIHAPHAKTVSVAGSFDDGKPHLMRRVIDGYWHITLELKRGRYEYRFLVDGVPTVDPKSFGTVSNPDGNKSSLLEVGY
jgi:hypothetical protein